MSSKRRSARSGGASTGAASSSTAAAASSSSSGKYATLAEAISAQDRAEIRRLMAERDTNVKRQREERQAEADEREAKRRRRNAEIAKLSDEYWDRLSEVQFQGRPVPPLLKELHRLQENSDAVRDYLETIDIELLDGEEPYGEELREERRAGFYPEDKEEQFNAANLPPLLCLAFANDAAGGYYAFWVRDAAEQDLEKCPVVVWDSEGCIGLMAPDLRSFLALLPALNAAKCALHTAIHEPSLEFPKELLGLRATADEGMKEGTEMETADVEDPASRKAFLEELSRLGIAMEEKPFDAIYAAREQDGLKEFAQYTWVCLE